MPVFGREWTPNDLSTAPWGWWDFSDNANLTLSGNDVLGATDLSGNGRNLGLNPSNAIEPVNTATINGVQAVRFVNNGGGLGVDYPTNDIDEGIFHLFMVIGDIDTSNDVLASSRVGAGVAWNTRCFPTSINSGIAGITGYTSNITISSGSDNLSTARYDLRVSGGNLVAADGSVITSWMNGGNETGDAGTNSPQSYGVGNDRFGIGANPQSGVNSGVTASFGEVILVKGDMSDDDRQRVEGYLAHKWGINLDPTHPYEPFPPSVATEVTGFDPRSIANCWGWWKGTETYTINAPGSLVESWTDLTDNARVLETDGAAASAPDWGENSSLGTGISGVNFNRSNTEGLKYSAGTSILDDAVTAFVVNSGMSSGTGDTLLSNQESGTGGWRFKWQGSNILFALNSSGSGVASEVVPSGQDGVSVMRRPNNLESTVWHNGTAGSTAAHTTYDTVGDDSLTVGYLSSGTGTGSQHISCFVTEILIYDRALTDDERLQVEGYLAHSNNQQSRLPADHPYKDAPPGVGGGGGGGSKLQSGFLVSSNGLNKLGGA